MAKEIEIVLVKDVKGLGKFGQTRKVKLGYARNYLLPYQFAILATPGNQLRFKSIEKREQKRVAEERAESEALASKVNGKAVSIFASAQETGALYGSVSAADIASAVQTELGVEIDRHWVALNENLKEVGQFDVSIEFPQSVTASIAVTVVAEAKEAKSSKKSAK